MSAVPWPNPPLRTDRVLLRPWSTDDLPVLVALGQDLTVARWFPVIPYPYTEDDAVDWLHSEEMARQAGKGITFAMAHTNSGEVLGGITVGNIGALLIRQTGERRDALVYGLLPGELT